MTTGGFKVSLDGGILWRDAAIGGAVRFIKYDSVYPDQIFAGTDRGIYKSNDFGLSWQPFGNLQTQLFAVLGLDINNQYIFATEGSGSGGSNQVWRFDRSGNGGVIAAPANDLGPLTVDPIDGQLYAAGASSIFRSDNSGNSWVNLGGAGFRTVRLVAKGGGVWQLSYDGLFHSTNSGASWQAASDRDKLIELYYSDHVFAGLTINQGRAFFATSTFNGRIKEVVENDADTKVTRLGLNRTAYDVTRSGDNLWAATDNGLWNTQGVVGSEEAIKRPVVIVPGVLGSWSVGGKWLIDPITNSYQSMLNRFVAEGYVADKTLFTFPYDWRQDNNLSAHQLADKLAEIRAICGCQKIDVIGHSMGGLVARAYIESDYYNSDVENLVMLGTPNGGSVEDYSIWEAGVSSAGKFLEQLKFKLFNLDAYEHGFSSITDYVRSAVPSVRQLLPVFSYIDGRSYPNGYPNNAFLDQLNQTNLVALLKQRVKLFEIGSDNQTTLTGLNATAQTEGYNWPDGQINAKYYGSGDNTVPSNSLRMIAPADLIINSDHGHLPRDGADQALAHLVSDSIETMTKPDLAQKYMMFYVKSPVRLSITDPNGQQINDAVDQIPRAFFTGSNAQVQFVLIPNPIDGQYQISLTGKGTGAYTVGEDNFDADDATGIDKTVETTGTTLPGGVTTLSFNTSTTQLIKTTDDPTPPSPSVPIIPPDTIILAPVEPFLPVIIAPDPVIEAPLVDPIVVADSYQQHSLDSQSGASTSVLPVDNDGKAPVVIPDLIRNPVPEFIASSIVPSAIEVPVQKAIPKPVAVLTRQAKAINPKLAILTLSAMIGLWLSIRSINRFRRS